MTLISNHPKNVAHDPKKAVKINKLIKKQ